MLNKTLKTLTTEEIFNAAPAVYAVTRGDNLSDKYLFISTSQLVNVLTQSGWTVVRTCGSRRRGNSKYSALHAVYLARKEYVENTDLQSNEVPLLMVLNAHNGKHAFKIGPAIMSRKSGAIYHVPNKVYPTPRIIHKTYNTQEVVGVAYTILSDFPKILKKIDLLKNTQLSPESVREFAKSAANIVFKAEDILRTDEYQGDDKVAQQLAGFNGFNQNSSVWDLVESISQNAFEGNVLLKRKSNKVTKSRKINSVKRHNEITQKILDLTAQYLEEKVTTNVTTNPFSELFDTMDVA